MFRTRQENSLFTSITFPPTPAESPLLLGSRDTMSSCLILINCKHFLNPFTKSAERKGIKPYSCHMRITVRTAVQSSLDVFMRSNLFKAADAAIEVFCVLCLFIAVIPIPYRHNTHATKLIMCDSNPNIETSTINQKSQHLVLIAWLISWKSSILLLAACWWFRMASLNSEFPCSTCHLTAERTLFLISI